MFRRSIARRLSLAAMIALVRPVIERALADPEFHQAVRQAFGTGRKVTVMVQSSGAQRAARDIGRDRKLQAEIQDSAERLQEAVTQVVTPPAKRARLRLAAAVLAGAAALAALLPFALKRLRSGGAPEQ